jgi:GntR family transcriptional regulator/MocR family aminotransferase
MTAIAALPGLVLDLQSGEPLHRQIYGELRRVILDGALPAGARLPATRDLAVELGISRNTVMAAFEQLVAEGYLEGRVGAGTYVTASLPDELLHAGRSASRRERDGGAGPRPAVPGAAALSARGRALAATAVTTRRAGVASPAFRMGNPDTSQFPFDEWARIVARLWRTPGEGLLRYGDPAGYLPLRRAIAEHLAVARAVRCTPEQVIVVSGSQQALDLAARVLLDPGDGVLFEDPGYLGARAALTAAGARIIPVPVDADGAVIDAAGRVHARAMYITPSHQFPLGVTMPLGRRLAVLDWAARSRAWIIEDDYDSEYRYAGRPHAALQGLDDAGRVIYVGTFSKVLFPSLRLGYLVVPPALAPAFIAAREISDRHPPAVEQAALAEFVERGHLARHIRRMRALYADRQALLLELAARQLAGLLEVEPCTTGLHLVGWLPEGVDDADAADRAAEAGVDVAPLSAYAIAPVRRGAFMLGYAALDARTMADGVRRLAGALAGHDDARASGLSYTQRRRRGR